MKLYIMRHGIAESPYRQSERPLTEEGIIEVQSVALHFDRKKIRIGKIVHSPILRAIQTASIMADTLAPPYEVEKWDCLKPMDSTDRACDLINQHRLELPSEDLLLIGHLPFIGVLAHKLVKDADIKFGEAYIACLESRDESDWTVERVYMPKRGAG